MKKRAGKQRMERPKATKISVSMPDEIYSRALAKTRESGQWNFSMYLRGLIEKDLKAA